MAKKLTSEEAMREASGNIDKFMGRKKKKKPPALCTCTNHLGHPKEKFRSKDAGLKAIIRKHMWTGKQFRVYRCPTSAFFHVAGYGQFKQPRSTP